MWHNMFAVVSVWDALCVIMWDKMFYTILWYNVLSVKSGNLNALFVLIRDSVCELSGCLWFLWHNFMSVNICMVMCCLVNVLSVTKWGNVLFLILWDKELTIIIWNILLSLIMWDDVLAVLAWDNMLPVTLWDNVLSVLVWDNLLSVLEWDDYMLFVLEWDNNVL